MTENNTPSVIHNAPVTTVGDNSPQAVVNDRTGLYLSIISFGFSALSLGVAFIIPMVYEARMQNLQDRVVTAERESRVMQERWNDLKVQLAARGIPTSDH